MPGTPELAVVFLLVLLLFGPDKLPELARTLAKATRQIRRTVADFRRQINLDD
jgi:TatA/E family protein of Tat protein translocase